MVNLIFFLLGFVFCLLLTSKPLKIELLHKNENIINKEALLDMAELQDKMLKPNATEDQKYEDFTKVSELMTEANKIMGGSDR